MFGGGLASSTPSTSLLGGGGGFGSGLGTGSMTGGLLSSGLGGNNLLGGGGLTPQQPAQTLQASIDKSPYGNNPLFASSTPASGSSSLSKVINKTSAAAVSAAKAAGGGAQLFSSSTSGLTPLFKMTPRSSSKLKLRGFAPSLSNEFSITAPSPSSSSSTSTSLLSSSSAGSVAPSGSALLGLGGGGGGKTLPKGVLNMLRAEEDDPISRGFPDSFKPRIKKLVITSSSTAAGNVGGDIENSNIRRDSNGISSSNISNNIPTTNGDAVSSAAATPGHIFSGSSTPGSSNNRFITSVSTSSSKSVRFFEEDISGVSGDITRNEDVVDVTVDEGYNEEDEDDVAERRSFTKNNDTPVSIRSRTAGFSSASSATSSVTAAATSTPKSSKKGSTSTTPDSKNSNYSPLTSSSSSSPSSSTSPHDPQSYITEPPMEELMDMTDAELSHVIGFIVTHPGVGRIKFLEPVNLLQASPTGTHEGIPYIPGHVVVIQHRMAEVYPEGLSLSLPGGEFTIEKDPIGTGLNVSAEIQLEKCWAMDKATGTVIDDETDPRFERHFRKLERIPGTTMLGFNKKTGCWRFRVDHF